MNDLRKAMTEDGGNLGWCKPYITDDGKIAFVECEGRVIDAQIDGADLDTTHDFIRPQELTAASFSALAHALHGDAYSDYIGYTDKELVTVAIEIGRILECDCCDCPYFKDCAAFDE